MCLDELLTKYYFSMYTERLSEYPWTNRLRSLSGSITKICPDSLFTPKYGGMYHFPKSSLKRVRKVRKLARLDSLGVGGRLGCRLTTWASLANGRNDPCRRVSALRCEKWIRADSGDWPRQWSQLARSRIFSQLHRTVYMIKNNLLTVHHNTCHFYWGLHLLLNEQW